MPITNFGPDEIDEYLQRARKGRTFDFAARRRRPRGVQVGPISGDSERTDDDIELQPGDLTTDIGPLPLQRVLQRLFKQEREWMEEQGLNVLFLAVGFLEWIDEQGGQAKSPLLLLPCDLKRSSPRKPFRLSREDDDAANNATLRHKLREFDISLPEFEHESYSKYLDAVSRLVTDRQGWGVTREVALATFQYTKLAMWEDLEGMRRAGVTHPLVRRLAGQDSANESNGVAATSDLPPDADLAGGGLDDIIDLRSTFTVLPADHSQLRAVAAAGSGQNLVIHGPPGTGKSQTIVNIISNLLAHGKRVLFVSEKSVALDVVKERLERENLGVFCLDMHSDRARKSSVYEQLQRSLDDKGLVRSFPFNSQQLEDRRSTLNNVVRALHEIRRPLGRSVYQVQGEYALLRDLPDVEFEVAEVLEPDGARLEEIVDLAQRVERRPREFHELDTSKWRALRVNPSGIGLADQLRRDADAALAAVERATRGLREEAVVLGVRMPDGLMAASRMGELASHIGQRPLVLPRWLQRQTLAKLRRVADEQREMQKRALELSERVEPAFGGKAPAADYERLSREARPKPPDTRVFTQAFGPKWGERLLPDPAAVLDNCVSARNAATDLVRRLEELAHEMGVDSPVSSAKTSSLVLDFAQGLVDLGVVPENWADPDGIAETKRCLAVARKARVALKLAEDGLFKDYDREIVDDSTVDREMLIRFRIDHRSGWRRVLGRAYKRDLRLLSSHAKIVEEKLDLDGGLDVAQRVLAIRSLRRDWEKAYGAVETRIGGHAAGLETDWERLEGRIDSLERLRRDWLWDRTRLGTLLASHDVRPALETATLAAHTAFGELDISLSQMNPEPSILEKRSPKLVADYLRRALDPLEQLEESTRAVVRGMACVPRDWNALCDLVDDTARLRNTEELEHKSRDALSRDYGEWFRDRKTDWDGVLNALNWCRTLLDIVGGKPSEHLRGLACAGDSSFDADASIKRIESLQSDYQRGVRLLDALFDASASPWGTWDAAPFDDLKAWLESIHEDADGAADWIEFRQAADGLDQMLSPGTIGRVRQAVDDATLVPGIVRRRLFGKWLDAVYRQDSHLSGFAAPDHEEVRRRFGELDGSLHAMLRDEIRKKLFGRYPNSRTNTTSYGQFGALKGELTKKRSQISVRRLLARCPTIIQALKPCFLMSPLAVSQYLERTGAASADIEFDTVIFDEASQVKPEDAVPAVSRSKQTIVVGDRKQLPPTAFFEHHFERGDDDGDDDETDWFEGRESILDVLVGMAGSGAAEHYLAVHYRSRHESLIRYSNHYFYDDRLLTFPSPEKSSDMGVKSFYLPGGRYDAGGSRTNRLEAEKVVKLVFDLMRKRPDESVGVVTLSRTQADLVETLVDEARLTLPEFDRHFAPERDERFFVKNLENVQGDERDHIVMSVGYGPTEAGQVHNRFGPINNDGGERRLNVAVSRARRSMTVVHSLRPEDVKSETQGAQLLKRYLEFARSPDTAFEQNLTVDTEAETERPLEEAVRRALVARGHRVDVQVGASGYRIDLAIHAEDGQGYALGIECDGATYHSAPAARDRDWLRQSVLEGLGWEIHRVWSRSWIQNPERDLEAIERALEEAVARRVDDQSEADQNEPDATDGFGAEFDAESKDADSTAAGQRYEKSIPDQADDDLFDNYEVADLSHIAAGPELREESLNKLCELIREVVGVEGPVHSDIVIERIRLRFRIGKVKGSTRSFVRYAIGASVGSDLGWLSEEFSGTAVRNAFLATRRQADQVNPRAPCDDAPSSDPSRRKVQHIPLIELKAGVLACAPSHYGSNRAELIRATARQFGFRRTGKDVSKRIGEAVDRLVEDGRLVGDSERLTVAD